jgi:hypothetical protein
MHIEPQTYHQNKEQWIELFRDNLGEDAYKEIEYAVNKIIDYFDYFIDDQPVILYNNQAIPVKTGAIKGPGNEEEYINQLINELVKLKESNHILFLYRLEKMYVKNMDTELDEVSYKLRYIAIKPEEVN